jgi:hypothetical protein
MKAIIKCFALTLLFSSNSCNIFSQTAPSVEDNVICPDLAGTYQIVLPYRMLVQLPVTICDQIEAARKDNERAEIVYSEYLKIIVFSRNELNQLSNVQEIVYGN